MAFDLGGIGKGLQAGLNYDVQYTRYWIWAVKAKNQNAIDDLIKIGEQNIREIVGTGTDVTESHAVSLLFAGDPFAQSRHLMQQFQQKYNPK